MVKVTGPLLSTDAAGSVANTLVFGKMKGQRFVRLHTVPANPRSSTQLSVRAMMQFLSQNWTPMSAGYKATWSNSATASKISPFNTYTSYNLTRWQNFQTPTEIYPPIDSDTEGVITNITATARPRSIRLSADLTNPLLNWAFQWFRDTPDGFTPSHSNMVHLHVARSANTYTWLDSPLAAETTFFYRLRAIALFGNAAPFEIQVSATPTA